MENEQKSALSKMMTTYWGGYLSFIIAKKVYPDAKKAAKTICEAFVDSYLDDNEESVDNFVFVIDGFDNPDLWEQYCLADRLPASILAREYGLVFDKQDATCVHVQWTGVNYAGSD